MAGVSRSASLVLAFLIRARGITLQRALGIVKGRRKIVI
jgi:protein-tyrosine phosphatase